MNGERSFLGQIPLVLGPSSWGFSGYVPSGATLCPPGTFVDDDGLCRPSATMGRGGGGGARGGGGLRPASYGRRPIQNESGFCGPEEIVGSDGICRPRGSLGRPVNLGQTEVPFSLVQKARRERDAKQAEADRACRTAQDHEREASFLRIQYQGSGVLFKDPEMKRKGDEEAKRAKQEREQCDRVKALVAEIDKWLASVLPSVWMDIERERQRPPSPVEHPPQVPTPVPVPAPTEQGMVPSDMPVATPSYMWPSIPTLPVGGLFASGGISAPGFAMGAPSGVG